jgi:hypothetical protein
MWQDHVREGCYPDCDMLTLGKLGGGFGHGEWDCNFTHEEQKTMMTLWCMFGSPLMLGAELTKLDEWTLSLLTNMDILNMLKNECRGIQLERTDNYAIWKNYNISDKTIIIGLFNISDKDDKISVCLDNVKSCKLYELWDGTISSALNGIIEATVPAHGVKVYRVKKEFV